MKPLTTDDSESRLKIFSDPEVMRYWNTAPWVGTQDARDFANDSNNSMLRKESLVLGVYLSSIGELAGKCMLFDHDEESKRAEIGFGLDRRCWAKGYISEAGEGLIQYGFNSLGLRRVEAESDPDNQASARSLEKLGFYQKGLLRQRWEINGNVTDSALYRRLAIDPSPQHKRAMHATST
ncbi:GNAT family N-acetyltransferase [Microbulbifer taiwanensis]|uniref:GNAT family N-acetyltransferase n=1 Tax=Microbulbifer taiwanensis TaxID=986746 RepID=A0ABW1YR71_9GAMM|nr:GNAT family N-acetyltransferase [Microbulbifer taiwanensis]